MVGRGGCVDDQAGAARGLVGGGRTGQPDVLADGQADQGAVQVDQLADRAGLEVTALVEDAVVGQVDLPVAGHDPAAGDDRETVVEGGVADRASDHRDDALDLRRERLEGLLAGIEEMPLEQQVLGGIAADHQLREDDEIGPGRARPADPLGRERGVGVDVADGRVELRQRQPDGGSWLVHRRIISPDRYRRGSPVLLADAGATLLRSIPRKEPLAPSRPGHTSRLRARAERFSTARRRGIGSRRSPMRPPSAGAAGGARRLRDSALRPVLPPAAAMRRSPCGTWRSRCRHCAAPTGRRLATCSRDRRTSATGATSARRLPTRRSAMRSSACTGPTRRRTPRSHGRSSTTSSTRWR